MISANGGLPAHRYTPQVTQRWPRGSEPASQWSGTKLVTPVTAQTRASDVLDVHQGVDITCEQCCIYPYVLLYAMYVNLPSYGLKLPGTYHRKCKIAQQDHGAAFRATTFTLSGGLHSAGLTESSNGELLVYNWTYDR